MKKYCCAILFALSTLYNVNGYCQIANATIATELTHESLNYSQSLLYDKIINGETIESISIIKTPAILNGIGEGKLTVSHPALPCDNLTFSVADYQFVDSNNYLWYGYMEDDDSLDCSQGSILILCHGGRIIGNLSTDNFHAKIYDLGEGLTALIKSGPLDENSVYCKQTSTGKPLARGTGTDPCETVKTKVLVLYTPAAANANLDIPGTAMVGVQTTNQIWANTQVDNSLSLVGVLPINLVETQNFDNDVKGWSIDPTVKALRDQYKAEIVVFFTGEYSSIFGWSKNVGGPKEDAYCIVEAANANNGHHTFAHEVSHLFGCRHDDDAAHPGINHGNIFNTGWWIFIKKRYTLMANGRSDRDKLEYLSTPDISYKGVDLGDATYRNNAQQVRDLKYPVASFYPDGSNPLSTSITVHAGGQCVQQGTAKANVQCGTAPYRYEWLYSENGINWYPYGTTQTIGYSVPFPPNNLTYNSVLLKVIVTDAGNNVVNGVTRVSYSCPHHNNPHGGNGGGLNRGINAASAVSTTSINPNPASGIVTINFSLTEEQTITVTLLDIQGNLILSKNIGNIDVQKSSYQIAIPENAANGTYFLNIAGNKGFQKENKITIKR